MRIIVNCADPPRGLERKVRQSLRLIEPSHLAGLDSIRLEDAMPEAAGAESEPEWVRRVREEGITGQVAGWYASPSADAPAFVMLYVRPIYRAVPAVLRWTPAPTLRILRALAHEVAHHLVATRGYVFDAGEDVSDEESLADRYAERALERAAARWPYKLGELLTKEVAGWHYARGVLDWREGKYLSAAERFYDAWNLDPKIKEASYWYWRSKDRLLQTRSR